jgi:hypothetical protein
VLYQQGFLAGSPTPNQYQFYSPAFSPTSPSSAPVGGFAPQDARRALAITSRRDEILYRFGAEVALTDRFSLAAQQQYISAFDTATGDFADSSWSSPQLMAKFAVIANECTVGSATLGLQPQTSITDSEIRDHNTILYPGFLLYRVVSDDLFMQAGTQFGVPFSSNPIYTWDWALSVGYWLYRNDYVMECGRRPLLTGVVPQAELFGKHVVNNEVTGNTFEDAFGVFGLQVEQPRDVIDMTLGARFFFRRLSWASGFSFPHTGSNVRRNEWLNTFQFNF